MARKKKHGYMEISSYYEHLIRLGKLAPGELLPTEEQLAVRHAVARTTIRRAFQTLVNKGLVIKRQGHGSHVAPAQIVRDRAMSSVTIAARRTLDALEYPHPVNRRRTFGYYQYLEAILTTLGEYARPFRIQYFSDDPESLEALALSVRQSGDLGVITFDVETVSAVDGLLAIGVPVVFVDSGSFGRKVDLVAATNRAGMKEATGHLLATTAGPLAFIGAESLADRDTPHRQRLEGFLDAHRDIGREVPPSYLFFGDVNYQVGQRVTEKVLALSPRPTGVVCSDDSLAGGLLDGLKQAGVAVPRDMNVVGFGDTIFSRASSPGLSTVGMDLEMMGRRAVELLERRIKSGDGTPEVIEVPTRLILRQSTHLRLPFETP